VDVAPDVEGGESWPLQEEEEMEHEEAKEAY
jgi:hypothetical protein